MYVFEMFRFLHFLFLLFDSILSSCQLSGCLANRRITLPQQQGKKNIFEAIFMPFLPRTQAEYECMFECMSLLLVMLRASFFLLFFCASRRFSRNIDDAPYFFFFIYTLR